jgi:hypothetical protein
MSAPSLNLYRMHHLDGGGYEILELTEADLPKNEKARLDYLTCLISEHTHVAAKGNSAALLAGLGVLHVEQSGLLELLRITEPDGTQRPMTIAEYQATFSGVAPNSISTLNRGRRGAVQFLRLAKAGCTKHTFVRSHYMSFEGVEDHYVLPIWDRVMTDTNSQPTEDDFAVAIAEHKGTIHVKKPSSLMKYKEATEGRARAIKAALASKDYDRVDKLADELIDSCKKKRVTKPNRASNRAGKPNPGTEGMQGNKTPAPPPPTPTPVRSSDSTKPVVTPEDKAAGSDPAPQEPGAGKNQGAARQPEDGEAHAPDADKTQTGSAESTGSGTEESSPLKLATTMPNYASVKIGCVELIRDGRTIKAKHDGRFTKTTPSIVVMESHGLIWDKVSHRARTFTDSTEAEICAFYEELVTKFAKSENVPRPGSA